MGDTFAALLRTWRRQALLTQAELARIADVSVRTVRRLETGKLQRPRLYSVRRLAQALRLTDAQQAILLEAAEPAQPEEMPVRQLPIDLAGFTGRAAQLDTMDKLLNSAHGCPPIVLITGTAGVGKTTLAIRWAHRVAHRFPDGQLYIDLRGFSPSSTPTAPSAALRCFLDALDIPPQRIPADLDAQVALYRSRMSGLRALVVLDNGHDADQVRPLLPTGGGSMVVVTSRRRLTGLGVSHSAHIITLSQLSMAESKQLLATRLGTDRIGAEPAALEETVQLCAGLPLALAITAARAAGYPDLPLAAVAAGMKRMPTRLDPFETADTSTDIRSVFSWSQRHLSAPADRLFRLLGLHPGPDTDADAAARLVDAPGDRVHAWLNELAEANLIREHRPGRYALHDLIRAYAGEQAALLEPNDQNASLFRLLDHYLRGAHAAYGMINPSGQPPRLPVARTGLAQIRFDDESGAIAWFITEYDCLLAMLDRVTAARCDAETWQLGLFIGFYMFRRGYWSEHLATADIAVRAAERMCDDTAQILTQINVARANLQLCRFDQAESHVRSAIKLARGAQDIGGLAEGLHILSWVLDLKGQRRQAVTHARQALLRYMSTGDLSGVARSLNTLGWITIKLGDHQAAVTLCQQALSLHRTAANREGEAATLHSLGCAYQNLGDNQQALACFRQAISVHDELPNPYQYSITLASIGDVHHAIGDQVAARNAWQAALLILEEIDHPEVDLLRARLDRPSAAASVH